MRVLIWMVAGMVICSVIGIASRRLILHVGWAAIGMVESEHRLGGLVGMLIGGILMVVLSVDCEG